MLGLVLSCPPPSKTHPFSLLPFIGHASKTKNDGHRIRYDYDALGRMVRRVDGYTCGSGAGQLKIVTAPGYQQTYRYDAYGRVMETATTIQGQTFTVASQYDRYSRPVTVQYPQVSGAPARLAAHTQYNALGYATGTYDASNGVLYSRVDAVDVLGNVTVTRLGNGVQTTRTFDLDTGYLWCINVIAITENDGRRICHLCLKE